MAAIGDEIDRLYQVPLSEFTPLRDALAKRAGARGTEIRRLRKPTVAAWAVNQVFWHRRSMFDRFLSASKRVRAAHGAHLAGKNADIAGAEAILQAALDVVVSDVRALLVAAGDAASPATLRAVTDTLRTLVWRDLDGRLAQPLKPTGLEALAGLAGRTSATAKRRATVIEMKPAGGSRETIVDRQKREREAKRRRIAETAQALGESTKAERRSAAAVRRAHTALERQERERLRLEAALEATTQRTQRLRRDHGEARKALDHARSARQRLDDLLTQLRSS
jgi:hypothetical protein